VNHTDEQDLQNVKACLDAALEQDRDPDQPEDEGEAYEYGLSRECSTAVARLVREETGKTGFVELGGRVFFVDGYPSSSPAAHPDGLVCGPYRSIDDALPGVGQLVLSHDPDHQVWYLYNDTIVTVENGQVTCWAETEGDWLAQQAQVFLSYYVDGAHSNHTFEAWVLEWHGHFWVTTDNGFGTSFHKPQRTWHEAWFGCFSDFKLKPHADVSVPGGDDLEVMSILEDPSHPARTV
jgi:hypothetical protein